MSYFEHDQSHKWLIETCVTAESLAGVSVRIQERNDIWSCLRNDVMVDVKQFGKSSKRRLSATEIDLPPGSECDVLSMRPRDNCACLVFAVECA